MTKVIELLSRFPLLRLTNSVTFFLFVTSCRFWCGPYQVHHSGITMFGGRFQIQSMLGLHCSLKSVLNQRRSLSLLNEQVVCYQLFYCSMEEYFIFYIIIIYRHFTQIPIVTFFVVLSFISSMPLNHLIVCCYKLQIC